MSPTGGEGEGEAAPPSWRVPTDMTRRIEIDAPVVAEEQNVVQEEEEKVDRKEIEHLAESYVPAAEESKDPGDYLAFEEEEVKEEILIQPAHSDRNVNKDQKQPAS